MLKVIEVRVQVKGQVPRWEHMEEIGMQHGVGQSAGEVIGTGRYCLEGTCHCCDNSGGLVLGGKAKV